MKLSHLFEDSRIWTHHIINLLNKNKNCVYVEFPPMHSSISMGAHHWSHEVAHDVISKSWVGKQRATANLSELHNERLQSLNDIRIVLRFHEPEFQVGLEAIGLNFEKPTEEPQFHVDDRFTEESRQSQRVIIDVNGVHLGGDSITWWPKEAVEVLLDFRQQIIKTLSNELQFEYDKKRDFWSK